MEDFSAGTFGSFDSPSNFVKYLIYDNKTIAYLAWLLLIVHSDGNGYGLNSGRSTGRG